jgi:hypothetical protein
MFNVINGGLHADNNLEIQEFMILPTGSLAFCEALRAGAEIYRTLKKILSKKGYSTGVGDEGGFAPDLKCDEEAIELLCEAVIQAGYKTEDVKIALDVAASGWAEGNLYKMPKSGKALDSDELIGYYERLISEYPIISIEDGLGEDDEAGCLQMLSVVNGMLPLQMMEHYLALDSDGLTEYDPGETEGLTAAEIFKNRLKTLKAQAETYSTDQLNDLFYELSDYIVTDMKSGAIMKIIDKADRYEILSSIHVPGEYVMEGDAAAAFVPDEAALQEIVMSTFLEENPW